MTIITTRARAYVNHGRWIADCPDECGGATMLDPRQNYIVCGNCKGLSTVEWPADPDGITEALDERRNAQNRNWYPKGHPVALRARCPHGQSVDDLIAETKEYQ
jgi:hypothetical protein